MYEGREYDGYLLSESMKKGSGVLISSFKWKYHYRRAENSKESVKKAPGEMYSAEWPFFRGPTARSRSDIILCL